MPNLLFRQILPSRFKTRSPLPLSRVCGRGAQAATAAPRGEGMQENLSALEIASSSVIGIVRRSISLRPIQPAVFLHNVVQKVPHQFFLPTLFSPQLTQTALNLAYSAILYAQSQKKKSEHTYWRLGAIALCMMLFGGNYALAELYEHPEQDLFFEANDTAWTTFLQTINASVTDFYASENARDEKERYWIDFWPTKKHKFPKIYISYAWDPDPEANRCLQQYLTRLRNDLKIIGCEVFLDTYDMKGSITETMKEQLASSDIILLACTERYFKRIRETPNGKPSPAGYEYHAALKKLDADPKKKCVIALHLGDSFSLSVPREISDVEKILAYDFRSSFKWVGYTQAVAGGAKSLLSIILDISVESPLYASHWKKYQSTQKNFRSGGSRTVNEKNLEAIHEKWKSPHRIQIVADITEENAETASQYSAYFAKNNPNSFVHCLSARNPAEITASFRTLANSLGITITDKTENASLISETYQQLRKQSPWLLVFENVSNYKEIQAYLDCALEPGQHILITSQESSASWKTALLKKDVPITKLPYVNSIEINLKKLCDARAFCELVAQRETQPVPLTAETTKSYLINAAKYYEEVFRLLEPRKLAEAYQKIGALFLEKNNYNCADAYLYLHQAKQLWDMYLPRNPEEKEALAYLQVSLGILSNEQNNPAEATRFFTDAVENFNACLSSQDHPMIEKITSLKESDKKKEPLTKSP
jgi:hypothetical protein